VEYALSPDLSMDERKMLESIRKRVPIKAIRKTGIFILKKSKAA
jgi:hypothetical protein